MLDMQTAVIDPLEPPAQPITIDPDYSIKGLVAAVIIQAVRDAARGDLGAVEWLQWDGLMWSDAVGFDAEQIISRWIAGGCQAPKMGSKAHKPAKPKQKRARKPQDKRNGRKPYKITLPIPQPQP